MSSQRTTGMVQLNTLVDTEKLEELLVAKWTQFIDTSKLLDFVTENINKHRNSLGIIYDTSIKMKGKQIMLSRFQLTAQGFLVWVEFVIPIEKQGMAIGTTELLISTNGIVSHIQTLGNIYFGNNSNNV